jgi:2-methylisocitrate lyase-like PEP mutase family enzyme
VRRRSGPASEFPMTKEGSAISARHESFARLHRPGQPVLLPNAWDYVTAAALAQAGFAAIGTTSLGVAAAAGLPDAAGATKAETIALTHRLAALPVLLTVDIEAGFSDSPQEVAGLAIELAGLGAVGVNIEDGRADGTLGPVDLHCAKIEAIRTAAPDLFVNARTDAFWLADPAAPPPVGEARDRAQAYVAAGASGIFIPAVAEPALVATLASSIGAPLNVLYLPGQHTLAELAAAGVARVSTGSLLIREALKCIVATATAALHASVPPDPARPTYAQIQALLPSPAPATAPRT